MLCVLMIAYTCMCVRLGKSSVTAGCWTYDERPWIQLPPPGQVASKLLILGWATVSYTDR